MNKEQQIEEMANYYCEYCKKQTGEKFCEHIDDKSCNIFFEAELFYNAGYHKVPKDSVVLSREEYDNLKLEIQKAHNKGVRVGFDLTKFKENSIEQARKETAKEIISFVEKKDKIAGKYSIYTKLVQELKEKYGVEVGE